MEAKMVLKEFIKHFGKDKRDTYTAYDALTMPKENDLFLDAKDAVEAGKSNSYIRSVISEAIKNQNAKVNLKKINMRAIKQAISNSV